MSLWISFWKIMRKGLETFGIPIFIFLIIYVIWTARKTSENQSLTTEEEK